MKNYLLKVDKDEVVVSGDEYSQIKEGIRNKINLVFLREGKLAINPIMIKLIQETHKPTEAQEREQAGQLKLSPGDRKPSTRTIINEFRKALGEDDSDFKNCGVCGESHFLGDRDTCLCCAVSGVNI